MEVYGYLKFKDGSDICLDGDYYDNWKEEHEVDSIVGFGEDDIGSEAHLFVQMDDGSEIVLDTLESIKNFFKEQ